eukprot:8956-Pelagococcus_subviridis.AAC.3
MEWPSDRSAAEKNVAAQGGSRRGDRRVAAELRVAAGPGERVPRVAGGRDGDRAGNAGPARERERGHDVQLDQLRHHVGAREGEGGGGGRGTGGRRRRGDGELSARREFAARTSEARRREWHFVTHTSIDHEVLFRTSH